MPNEPSLSEITSIRGDADLGYGTAGVGGTDVKFDFSKGIDYLMQASKEQAEATKFRVQQETARLKDQLANFDNISVDGVMEKDMPEIGAEYADFMSQVASNYDIIKNPNLDQAKFGELRTKEAQLRAKIAQSKQDVLFRNHYNTLIQTSPNLNTDENRAKLEDFNNGSLGSRTYGSLSTPFDYNPETIAKLAREAATREVETWKNRKGNEYFDIDKLKEVEKDAYMKFWREAHNGTDNLGRAGYAAAKKAYEQSGSAQPFDKWLDQMGEGLMGSQIINKEHKIQADPTHNQREMMDYYWASLRQQKAYQDRSLDLQYGNPKDLGRAKNEAFTITMANGQINPEYGNNMYNSQQTTKVKVEVPTMIDVKDATGKVIGQRVDPKGPKTTVEREMPTTQYLGSKLVIDPQTGDRKLVVTTVDNTKVDGTGKLLPVEQRMNTMERNEREVYGDYNRAFGGKTNPLIVDQYSQEDLKTRVDIRSKDKKGKYRWNMKNPHWPSLINSFQLKQDGTPINNTGKISLGVTQ